MTAIFAPGRARLARKSDKIFFMSRLALYLSDLQRFGIAPGLERIESLLARAGNPHLNYPHILIGGTNGKGSTAEFTARALTHKNWRRIGLYTSPHLYSWNERIRILPGTGLFEGAISDAELDELLADALPHIADVARELGQPTEFEVMTFLGLWHFARRRVHAAVLEVGLGGKWDATNATDPKVSAVTHVALDHMDRLGDTVEEIAADKVCIARAGRPFVTAETRPSVLKIFHDYCEKIGAELTQVALSDEEIGGDFQVVNRALALTIAQSFALDSRVFSGPRGFPRVDSIPATLGVPGRIETIAHAPRVLIDGANNPDGARQLALHLKRNFGLKPSETILVLGILKDKDWRQMTEILAPLARLVICTQSDSPRALAASELARETRKYNANVEIAASVTAATSRARDVAAVNDTILITGSFTLIAEVPRP